MVIELPIDKFIQDKNEIESFKQIKKLSINMSNNGCTCFCKVFMLFVSYSEIKCDNSKVLQSFAGINSINKFLEMGLPLLQTTTPTGGTKPFQKVDKYA